MRVLCALLIVIGWPVSTYAKDDLSICYGTTSQGRLVNGVKLPINGENFQSYSAAASLAGRTYVHSEVAEIILSAYQSLSASHPDKVFMYAETGWREGGHFPPHKTHQNGLSVDFMTPVVNEAGQSVHLPTYAWNRYGYDIEFDQNGRVDKLEMDFEALAAHIVALHRAAHDRGHDLWRVIFDPNLQPKLLETSSGEYIRKHITLSRRPSWVRHDEHYHVDFAVACEPY